MHLVTLDNTMRRTIVDVSWIKAEKIIAMFRVCRDNVAEGGTLVLNIQQIPLQRSVGKAEGLASVSNTSSINSSHVDRTQTCDRQTD